jgi:hypothetical protein
VLTSAARASASWRTSRPSASSGDRLRATGNVAGRGRLETRRTGGRLTTTSQRHREEAPYSAAIHPKSNRATLMFEIAIPPAVRSRREARQVGERPSRRLGDIAS